MVVLSLFDGMSTGQLALKNAGIPVTKYYASEIKPYAIKLTQHHFHNTVQLGGVTRWREWDIDWGSIDLVLSGSPCQDLSSAGFRRGLKGSKSSLFWVFVDILNHIRKYNPDVLFLQENVASASKKDIGIMSRALGVYPVLIDSALVTAQRRRRLYWTNIRKRKLLFDYITDIPLPKDRGILFQDIIESGRVDKDKAVALLERYANQVAYADKYKLHKYLKKRSDGRFGGLSNYVITEEGLYRALTQTEMERLQGFPDGYTSILSYREAGSLLGDAWTLPIIEHIFSFIDINKTTDNHERTASKIQKQTAQEKALP